VTGDKLTFEDGIEAGRRIWNLDNAIWTLQGRHRDMVHFAPYLYETKFEHGELFPFYMWPCRDAAGAWRFTDLMGRTLDKGKVDEWKTIYYRLEGWNTKTGWPKRSTLEQLGLGSVADALQTAGRLGEEEG
jgi:aldehyde:ferredoxin oxidoreductase